MFFKKIQYISTIILLVALLHPSTALSVMESSSYRIDFDSLNFGGGYSSSANYQLQDTAGEIASGDSSSASFQMRAGYQQMNSSYIAINGQNLVDLGNSPGITVSNVSSSTVVNVITDSYGGYELTIRASTSPALTSGPYYFSDYTPVSVDPDYAFTVSSNDSEFGFAVSGTDVIQRYKNNGSACNAGSSSTASTCWDGLSTTPATVAERHSSNHPLGSDTTFYYQAGIGTNKIQEAGAYSASIIITATAL
jgi:hypothetical protein